MKNRKANLLFILICIFSCSFQISKTSKTGPKFLFKKIVRQSCEGACQHIEVKRKPIPDTGFYIISLDDRDIIAIEGYSINDQIELLEEYLYFRGDTSASNKTYKFEGAMSMKKPENSESFTIEVEALYSFTRFLVRGYPPIRPVLVDEVTGEEINRNREKMDDVYKIYYKWYKEQKKNGFQRISSFPLDGTRYRWQIHGKSKFILKDSLQD